MKTIKKVEVEVQYVDGDMPSFEVMKEGVIYISDIYKVSIHRCLCGCGNKTVLPLIKDGWTVNKDLNGKHSFSPSVGNYSFPCKSHYIITKNVANFV